MTPAESSHLMERIAEVYARRLHESPDAHACLEALDLCNPELLEDFKAGYCDGTLPAMLDPNGEAAALLQTKGLLTDQNQEPLRGCIVVPVWDHQTAIVGFCGLKPAGSDCEEILVPNEVQGIVRGTLTRDASALYITTCVIDAFRFWIAGFRNVLRLIGTFINRQLRETLFPENAHTKAWFCSRGTGTDTQTIKSLQSALDASPNVAISTIPWPEQITGPRDYFKNHTPEEFTSFLESLPTPKPEGHSSPRKGSPCFTEIPEGMDATLDGRHYEIRAIRKPGPGRLRATLRAIGDNGRFVVETVNFYYLRSRRGFVAEAARIFHQPLTTIETDLAHMTDELERYVQKLSGTTTANPLPSVEAADRNEALKFGRAADLVDQIVKDMGTLGVIGEETNKLLSYLVMTSRKMPEPLALLILSGSGAGKSHLQDTALSLCPEEDLIKLTSLTDQALFYRGENSLRHKALALEEHLGAKGAAYPLRSLISARKLVIETTVKNPASGKLETQVNTVYGPTAVFQTTTNPNTDPETRSRFIMVSVDESPVQTRAILERQRHVHTLEALHLRQTRQCLIHRHHAFQRLLKPLPVVNPYEPLLSYPDQHLLVRRDQPKYLQLILAVTFLHQMQRPVRHDQDLGDYLETTLDDIAIANDLAHRVLGNSLADLSTPARELLELIENHLRKKHGTQEEHPTFTRRELREAFHWGDTRLRVHLKELVDMEYAAPLQGRSGLTYRYCLLNCADSASGRCLPGLKSVEQLRLEANLAGLAPTPRLSKREVATDSSSSGAAPCRSETTTPHPCEESPHLQSVKDPRA